MKLKRIDFRGFMRFKGTSSIEFPSGQVTLIVGENGAGKTTILDALCICLYAKTARTSGTASSGFLGLSDLVNHDSTRGAVRVEFENRGHNYVVTREIGQHKTGAEILEDGVRQAIDSQVSKYVANRAIGLDWQGFRRSSIVLQGEMSSLTSLDPSERRSAFESLFGLDMFSKYEVLARERAQAKAGEMHITQEANRLLQADVDRIPSAKRDIVRLNKLVRSLGVRHSTLGERVNSKGRERDDLERSHTSYLKTDERLNNLQRSREDAARTVKEREAELLALKVAKRELPALQKAYSKYVAIEQALNGMQPLEAQYEAKMRVASAKVAAQDGEIGYLAEDRASVVRLRGQIKSTIASIPPARDVRACKKELDRAQKKKELDRAQKKKEVIAGSIAESNGQITQMEAMTQDMQRKMKELEGKNQCPVCLQEITDPAQVLSHYSGEISKLEEQEKRTRAGLVKLRKELRDTASEIPKLESVYRDLSSRYDRRSMLESRRLDLRAAIEKVKGRRKSIVGLRGELSAFRATIRGLGFDKPKYDRLNLRLRKLRKEKVPEKYSGTKSKVDRIPEAISRVEESRKRRVEVRREIKTVAAELHGLRKDETFYQKARQEYESVSRRLRLLLDIA